MRRTAVGAQRVSFIGVVLLGANANDADAALQARLTACYARRMRAFPLSLLLVVAACGTPSQTDAGTVADSGAEGTDAGVDAGTMMLVCLPDLVDAGEPTDAGWDGGLDFSCRGLSPGVGGQAELVIAGKTTRAGFTRTALPDVRVELVQPNGTVLATSTAGDGGAYRLAFDAGCFPVNAELRATYSDPTDAGFYVTWSVPPSPWQYDRAALELILFDQSLASLVAGIAGVTIRDGGVLALHVADCAGNPVQGATVSTAGNLGDIRYVGANGLPSSALTATSTEGDVLIFNIPSTTLEVTASRDGGVIGSRAIPVHLNAITGSTLVP